VRHERRHGHRQHRTGADAGPTANVLVTGAVALNGAASSDADGDALTFTWTMVRAPGAPPSVEHDVGGATFTPDVLGAYGFSLVVSDGKASSAAASITVTAIGRAMPTTPPPKRRSSPPPGNPTQSYLSWHDTFRPGDLQSKPRTPTARARGRHGAGSGGSGAMLQWQTSAGVTMYRSRRSNRWLPYRAHAARAVDRPLLRPHRRRHAADLRRQSEPLIGRCNCDQCGNT